jgi:hypothetical protein
VSLLDLLIHLLKHYLLHLKKISTVPKLKDADTPSGITVPKPFQIPEPQVALPQPVLDV